ncbi:hypothetical protein EFS18_13660, partial [Levilactobacillus brevis]|nr:hypothetical protein [Levilactobacillus brevis]
QYALFSLFYKKGVDGFYPSTPNIIEPKKSRHWLKWRLFLFYLRCSQLAEIALTLLFTKFVL